MQMLLYLTEELQTSFNTLQFFELHIGEHFSRLINPLNANPEKRSNTLKQIVGNLPTICLSVFDHFMNLALKGLKIGNTDFTLVLIFLKNDSSFKNITQFLLVPLQML